MKITFFLFIFFWVFSNTTLSQSYWGQTTLSGSTNEAIDVESDNLGNQYVAGYFSGGTSFELGVPQINTQGNTDIYVAKYSPAGALLWVKSFGGSFSDKATDLALDNLGNILVTGSYFGQVNFGSTTLNSINGSKDVFILKLDNSGNVLWAVSEGGSGSENSFGIAVDGLNNIIITGQFLGSSNIGGQALTSQFDPIMGSANYDMFVSKYSSLGAPIWIEVGFAKYAERALAVDIDSQNDVFITGQFSDTLTMAGTTINNTDFNVGLVAKLNSAGVLQWLNLLKAGTVIPYDVELNNSDEPVIVGDFTGPMLYIDGAGNTSITAPSANKIFALKINNSGIHLWNSTSSSSNNLSARTVSIDTSKNVYITGYFECGWTDFQTGSAPSATFNSAGFKDPYLISIDNTGALNYARTFGSNKNDQGHGIAFDNIQNPVICGSNTQDLNIPTSTAGTYVSTPSPFDFFTILPTSYQGYAEIHGDLTTNSFLTNAVNGTTPLYNYFFNLPIDSLYGSILGNFDTVTFCLANDLYYLAQTLPGYGPEYTYLWNDGSTNPTLTITQSGTYSLEIQREDGCVSGTDSIVGIALPNPTLPLMSDNFGIADSTQNYPTYSLCAPDSVSIWFNDLCDGCTISINPAGIFDTLPHIYTQAAEYTVTVSLGICQVNNSFWILLDSIQPFDSIQPYLHFLEDTDLNDTISICPGDTLKVHAYDSLSNPPSPILGTFHDEPFDYFVFSSNNTFLPFNGLGNNMFVNAFRPDSSGWYVFEYFASIGYQNICGVDTLHYFVYDSIYVDVAAVPGSNIVITAADSLCPSSATFLIASPSDSNFIWTGPSVVFVSPGNDSAQVAAAGLYHYQGILMDSTTGCNPYIDITFDLQEIQTPSIISNPLDGVICPGDSVLLSVPSGYQSYNWVDPFGNSTSTTNTLYSNAVGSYYCNVVDSNGCSLTSTPSELTQYSTPGINASPQNILCENIPITISVTTVGSSSINWINPPSAGSAPQITVTQAGTYICEIVQCGITTTDSVVIIDGSFTINLVASNPVLCYNDSVYLSVDTGYTYVWNNFPDTANFMYASTSSLYSVVATNEHGCEAYSDTLGIFTAPFAYPPNVGDTTICYGDSVTLIDNGFTIVYWYDQDTTFLASNISYSSPPLYQSQTILATYNAQGCPEVYDTVDITVIEPIAANMIIGDTILCMGDSSILSLTNGLGLVNWLVNDIFTIADSTITIYSDPNSINQEVKIVNSNACFTDSISVNVMTIPVPNLSVDPDTVTICGTEIQTVNSTSNLDSIVWATPFGDEFGTSIDVSQLYPHASTVQVQGYDTNACLSNSATVYVEVTDQLVISIVSSPTICLDDIVTLIAAADANQYTWSGPAGVVNDDEINFTLASNEGVYTVSVTDSLGCVWPASISISALAAPLPSMPDTICCFTEWLKDVSSDTSYFYSDDNGFAFDSLSMTDNTSYQVTVTDSLGCQYSQSIFVTTVSCDTQLPNVISANNDGINDYFLVKFSCNQSNDNLKILNRWGNVVFNQTDYHNNWDGDNLVDGTYFYIYTWDTTDPKSEISKGFVTIVR